MEGFDFQLSLSQFGWGREGFGPRLAALFAGQPVIGTMARIIWTMTTTVWLTALAAGGGDGAATKVADGNNRIENGIALLKQNGKRVGQRWGPPLLAYHNARTCAAKKEAGESLTSMSRTHPGFRN